MKNENNLIPEQEGAVVENDTCAFSLPESRITRTIGKTTYIANLHFKEHDAEMSVAAVPYTVSVPYGIFELEGRDIQGLIEKPTYNYYANAGIYLIKRRALDEIPDDIFFNATDLIEKLISEGKKVIRFPLNGTWIDIGNPQEYQKANELVKHIL